MNRRNSFVGIGKSGNFLHYCHCGKWGAFGHDVNTLAGELGVWYCAEHNPTDAQKAIAFHVPPMSDFQQLAEQYGSAHLVPLEELAKLAEAHEILKDRLRMLHKIGKGSE